MLLASAALCTPRTHSHLAIERVCGVGVEQQLWQEHLEDVHKVKHGRPRLVDDV